MIVTKINLKNWKNFKSIEVDLRERTFIIGPNAAGKSNFIDAFRFLRDVAQGASGGLARALAVRGGIRAIRSLAARRDPEVSICIDVAESADLETKWKYELGLKNEGKGSNRDLVSFERVWEGGVSALERPESYDTDDPDLLTQTHLEQVSRNRPFRQLAEFLAGATYLHLVPQLLKHADQLGGYRLEGDPFGQGFLERVAGVTDKVRESRLRRINRALKVCVPQMKDLRFVKDQITGRPHLEALYEHWRPNAGWQRESQFSDGTLRLLGLMWALLDGDSLLLLEEPELSLNDAIVGRIPELIRQIQKTSRNRRQVIVTTHSEALLEDNGIDGREVVRFEPNVEGTSVAPITQEEERALKAGLSPADVLLPKTKPDFQQIELNLGS